MLKRFGTHQIQYGVVKDHGIYEHLRVSIEVDDATPTTGIVYLNGKTVGSIEYVGKKKFRAARTKTGIIGEFTDLGRAAASVISEAIEIS